MSPPGGHSIGSGIPNQTFICHSYWEGDDPNSSKSLEEDSCKSPSYFTFQCEGGWVAFGPYACLGQDCSKDAANTHTQTSANFHLPMSFRGTRKYSVLGHSHVFCCFLQKMHFCLLTVSMLKQVSAFRLCCIQAYATDLAAIHFEQQKKNAELEQAKADADAKAESFGNFRPLRVFQVTNDTNDYWLLNLAKLLNCPLDLKSPFEFRSLHMIDLTFNFKRPKFCQEMTIVNVFQFLKNKLLYGWVSWRRSKRWSRWCSKNFDARSIISVRVVRPGGFPPEIQRSLDAFWLVAKLIEIPSFTISGSVHLCQFPCSFGSGMGVQKFKIHNPPTEFLFLSIWIVWCVS